MDTRPVAGRRIVGQVRAVPSLAADCYRPAGMPSALRYCWFCRSEGCCEVSENASNLGPVTPLIGQSGNVTP